jgi:hypothetical protein
MRKLGQYLGILLIAISFIGTLFFKHYNGEIISYPVIWYLGFTIVGLTGLLLIYKSGDNDNNKWTETHQNALLKFKASSRKMNLDPEKCEFKSGSYSHQIEDPDMTTYKVLIPHSLSMYMDTTKTEMRQLSYLIYSETNSIGRQRFISYPFPVDKTTLEYYVITNKLVLYVDRFDQKKYYFDLEP